MLPGERGEGPGGRPGHHVLLPPGAWTATVETLPWAQASGAGPASAPGALALASITGRPDTWPARVAVSCASAGLATQVRRGRSADPGPAHLFTIP